MNSQIKPVAHQPKPVTLERDVNDVVIIEGVRYSGEYFRILAFPNPNMLYAIRRDGDQVWLTEIHNPGEAQDFFLDIARRGDPAPTDGGA